MHIYLSDNAPRNIHPGTVNLPTGTGIAVIVPGPTERQQLNQGLQFSIWRYYHHLQWRLAADPTNRSPWHTTSDQIILRCLKSSPLWNHVQTMQLTINMRITQATAGSMEDDAVFHQFLLHLGGENPHNPG